MSNVHPLVGDVIDGVKVTRVWSTGKVDLADGASLHERELVFVAGDSTGAMYTRKESAS